MDGPFLASASAHLLASLKQWQIFTWGIRPARVLQFIIREEWLRLQVESLVIQSNTTAASILISTATVFRAKHKVNSSLKAHSSALVAYPMFLVKPLTHCYYGSIGSKYQGESTNSKEPALLEERSARGFLSTNHKGPDKEVLDVRDRHSIIPKDLGKAAIPKDMHYGLPAIIAQLTLCIIS